MRLLGLRNLSSKWIARVLMDRPDCSIVVPAYNCLGYLPAALSSIQVQRTPNVEIIVLDDGSTDGTGPWLAAHSREWPALRVIETGGIGPAKARNAGIGAARAPLIAFLDADDWWWPEKLRVQLAYHHAHPETAFSFGDYLHISPEGESRGSCFDYWRPRLARKAPSGYFRLNDALGIILATNLVGTSTVMARKQALEAAGGFAELASAEDWALWLRLSEHAPAACTRSITASYLMRAESQTSNREARIDSMARIVASYGKHKSASVRQSAVKARARIDIARAEHARLSGRHSSAALYHSRALMALPSARLGKAATASILSAALHFVSGYGAR